MPYQAVTACGERKKETFLLCVGTFAKLIEAKVAKIYALNVQWKN